MTRQMRALLVACGAVTTLVVLALGQSLRLSAQPGDVIARVDDLEITRGEFDQYAKAFVLGDGTRVLPDAYILLALVNQEIALSEADRRGFSVSESAVDSAVAAAANLGVLDRVLATDPDGYRARLRTKMLFDQVHEALTAAIEPTQSEVRSYFDAHVADYPGRTFDEVKFEIATVLDADMVDARWREWLSERRACATITVVDSSFVLPPETFDGTCPP